MRPLRFGIFLAPFHPVDENPTLQLERDFQLIEHLDRLDYDEAWVGEHHSAGYEIIASPEVFIAGAAERTRRIRLGSGRRARRHREAAGAGGRLRRRAADGPQLGGLPADPPLLRAHRALCRPAPAG